MTVDGEGVGEGLNIVCVERRDDDFRVAELFNRTRP